VTNEATNTTIRVTTDESGAYIVPNLIPGSYTVTASREGFRPVAFRQFVLQVSQNARLDISLEVGGVEQTIEV
jgi:carboxypeptidase family protein